MSSSLRDTLSEIVDAAPAEGVDPVTLVQDYLDEKGSHLSRAEVERILRANVLTKE